MRMQARAEVKPRTSPSLNQKLNRTPACSKSSGPQQEEGTVPETPCLMALRPELPHRKVGTTSLQATMANTASITSDDYKQKQAKECLLIIHLFYLLTLPEPQALLLLLLLLALLAGEQLKTLIPCLYWIFSFLNIPFPHTNVVSISKLHHKKGALYDFQKRETKIMFTNYHTINFAF